VPLGQLPEEAELGLLMEQHLQTMSREVGLALDDSAGDSGFGFLTDQHLQTLSREVGLALRDSAGRLDLVCTTGCLRRIV